MRWWARGSVALLLGVCEVDRFESMIPDTVAGYRWEILAAFQYRTYASSRYRSGGNVLGRQDGESEREVRE